MDSTTLPLQFIDHSTAVTRLAKQLNNLLASHQNVLWFVSGGSCIELEVAIRDRLNFGSDTTLNVALVDERYVTVEDANSNAKQLLDAGFKTEGVNFNAALQPDLTLVDTANRYETLVAKLFEQCDVSFGVFGMGADGHTAGLLPDCPLLKSNQELVGTYQGFDFERISLTPLAIGKLDHAALYAAGEAKWPQLKQLNEMIDSVIMPVQLLKQFEPLEIYTDYKEGDV